MAAVLRDVIVVVVVGRTRPRSMPLAMLHGVSLSICMHACDPVLIVMVLRLAASGAAELHYNYLNSFEFADAMAE